MIIAFNFIRQLIEPTHLFAYTTPDRPCQATDDGDINAAAAFVDKAADDVRNSAAHASQLVAQAHGDFKLTLTLISALSVQSRLSETSILTST